jgi:hypothetical protein
MQRFYFHLRDGTQFVPDETGMDLSGMEEARREAIQSAREILADQLRNGEALDGQRIEISDDTGTVLEVVTFKDALRPDGSIH